MNKKQLIVLWVIAILVIVAIIFPPQIYNGAVGGSNIEWRFIGELSSYRNIVLVVFLFEIIIISLLGGLLVYTLRDKKK